MIAPLPPMVVNGVIFAASSGEYQSRRPCGEQRRPRAAFLARRAVCARRVDRQGNLEQRQHNDGVRARNGVVVESGAGLSGDVGQYGLCVRDAVRAAMMAGAEHRALLSRDLFHGKIDRSITSRMTVARNNPDHVCPGL